MMEEVRIDEGNFDWIVGEDEDGNIWVRPSLEWKDGEVYEWLRDGQALYNVLTRAGEL